MAEEIFGNKPHGAFSNYKLLSIKADIKFKCESSSEFQIWIERFNPVFMEIVRILQMMQMEGWFP